jgi:hypothetical protein
VDETAGLAWATDRLDELGHRATGPAEQIKSTPWSTVYQIPTAGGPVWFKANGGHTRYEARLAAALATWVPDRVLAPLAVEPHEGWQLLPDGGTTLRGLEANTDPRAWEEFVAAYAELQREVTPHTGAMLALGVPDQRPSAMPDRLASLLDDGGVGLSDEVRGRVRALTPRYADACARLAEVGPAATIQHDDLHSNNVLPTPNGHRFFDWGDASVAHPFTTLLVTLRSFAYTLEVKADDPVVLRVRDAYLEPWRLGGDGPALVELASWTGIPGRALAWQRSLVAAPPEDHANRDDPVAGWLEELLSEPDR